MSETDLAARLEELAETQTWNREFAKLAWEHKADIIAALRAGVKMREALAGIIQHFSVTRWRDNAPGHGHLTPGVWDDDVSNGSNAGQPCEWCAEWKAACALALPTPPAKEAPND